MTSEQFAQLSAEILAKVPISFHAATIGYAWANGHASGYESVLEILTEVVDEVLLPSLKETQTNDD
jgi:hypothetical protein